MTPLKQRAEAVAHSIPLWVVYDVKGRKEETYAKIAQALEDFAKEAYREGAKLQEENERFRKTLESISKNSCCEPCMEAGLWAKAALEGK